MRFSDIVGHSKEIEIIQKALAGGRVAHAYLFCGPDGVGKKLAAHSLACALNCERGGVEACRECARCRAIETGAGFNVTVTAPEDGLIKIDKIRELQERLRYRVEGGRKVAIVDSAEKMMPAAANAFLKTLEEPPADSVIILVTSRVSELLPTIISRCQKLTFRPVAVEVITDFLVSERGMDAADAAAATRLSAGSIARAIEYAEEGAGAAGSEISKIMGSIEASDTYSVFKAAEAFSRRDDLEEALDFVKAYYRDKAVCSLGAPELASRVDAVYNGTYSFTDIWECYTAVEHARRQITPPRYANKQLTMEVLFMTLAERGGLS